MSGMETGLAGLPLSASGVPAPLLAQLTELGLLATPANSIQPANSLAQTYPRHISNGTLNTGLLVSQRLTLVAIELKKSMVISSITFVSGTTALSVGVNQFFALYDDAAGSSFGQGYALLAQTNDDGATAWTANTAKTLNLAAPYRTVRAGLFYLGILVNATTVPTLLSINFSQTLQSTGPPVLCGASNTGVTTPPNPANAPGASGASAWAWVS